MSIRRRPTVGRTIVSAVLALAATLLLAATASAATTFNVTRTDDPAPATSTCLPSGPCSLRQAVNSAADGDTVSVPANASQHYLVTQGEITVRTAITITGGGPRTTIVDAQGNSGVFVVESPNGGLVTIQGLTVTGGGRVPQGGGIQSRSPLTLNDDAVSGNTAGSQGGGISSVAFLESGKAPGAAPTFSKTPLNISSSTISGNSVNAGTLSFAPTSAPFDVGGGGIAEDGGATLTNVTVSDNGVTGGTSQAGGGGILVAIFSGELNTLNTTIAGNSVNGAAGSGGGGIASSDFNLAPKRQISEQPSYTAQNTIVANDSVNGTANQDCAGVSTTSDHNLSLDSSCGFTDAGSQHTDPALGQLLNNGGDTDTRAINAASSAFNTADDSGCPTLDQRGVGRPQAGVCDIGAYEYVPNADLALTKSANSLSVTLGANVTYTLTATNNGPDAASGVTVQDALPAGETLVSASPSQGSCAAATCSLGALASGAHATITIVAHTTQTGTLVNSATVHADQVDPNPANNTASATTLVAAAPASGRAPRVRISGAHCVKRSIALHVRIASSQALRGVRVLLDGKLILKTHKKTFTIHLTASQLRHGHNTLSVSSSNKAGKSHTARVSLRQCAKPKPPRFTG